MGGGSTGLRTSKQATRQAQGDRAEVSTFLWDGQRLLAEIAGGSTVAQYTAGLGAYGPMLSQRRGTTSSFYHPTDLGTIENLTDASGNVTDSYAFTAFGVPVATSGGTANPHRYIGALGYYTDPTTGLSYVRARYLRPTTGSWLSVDPVPSEPRYQYVGGRASRASDARGAGPVWWETVKALPSAAKEVYWDEPGQHEGWGPGTGYASCLNGCLRRFAGPILIGGPLDDIAGAIVVGGVWKLITRWVPCAARIGEAIGASKPVKCSVGGGTTVVGWGRKVLTQGKPVPALVAVAGPMLIIAAPFYVYCARECSSEV